ncbi:MAG: EpsG family protein [Lachnospiraceae bacterium]|nr:EpsG family protein [Lachnospiraceae bacterium]
MILYITVAVVTALLASLVDNHPRRQSHTLTRQQLCNRVCLTAIFLILFLLSACRLNVGNDYAKYVEFMHLVNCDAYVPTEIGFNLLVRLIYGLSGYENFLLVFAFYSFVTALFFLLAMYEQSDEFGLAFFLFMTLGYYFQTFSTVRYYLALALALYSMKFVLRKQWGRFVVLILLGAAFHKSLLVVIPLYFLASLPWKKWQLAIAAVFCTTFLFLQDFYLKLVIFLYPTYEDTEYLEGGTSYISILRCAAVLFFAGIVYLLRRREEGRKTITAGETESGEITKNTGCETGINGTENATNIEEEKEWNQRFWFYTYLNLGALVLYVFCSFLPIISRIGYYLMVSQILFLPMLLKAVPDKKWRRLFRAGILLAAVLYFAMYLKKGANDGVLILPYKTFFFHEMVEILSDVN